MFREVIVFAAAAAVAVLILAYAGGLFQPVKPYGEPLPYLTFKNTSRGIEVGVFDYAGYAPRAAHIYVNGRYAGSAASFVSVGDVVEGWTGVYVKCGDFVEVLVQYDGFQKKFAGQVRCSEPLNAPERELKVFRDPTAVQFAEVRNAMDGYADVAGVPLGLYLACSGLTAEVYAKALEPDTLLCTGTACGGELRLVRTSGGFTGTFIITVARPITAAVTNFFGAKDVDVRVVVEYYGNPYSSEWLEVSAVVDGKSVYLGTCERHRTVQYSVATDYVKANASGVFQLYIVVKDGSGNIIGRYKTTLIYYERNGTSGYEILATETDDPIDTKFGAIKMKDNQIVEVVGNTLIEAILLDQLTPEERSMAARAIKTVAQTHPEALGAVSFSFTSNETRRTGYWAYNVPMVAVAKYVPSHVDVRYSSDARSKFFVVGVPSMVSLGAALATSVLPPPETPQVVTNSTRYAFS
ncbi:hypothetical protein Pogu_2146 [Pyrobaculum oguniense TE7]|uniref:Uncharacterized protein n=1 Tax=Pyrobaculum oguniense (strain DSM 13380 / JCM 10595 / TE7) TaxID=698757 RepID=H6QCX4_PYROT|nr:hypothetical protein Pogu_2146 [Pyrobaculum oguniense TE7]